jgi:hypothetical protein
MKQERNIERSPIRKPFQSPRLKIYGRVSDLTLTHPLPITNEDGGVEGHEMRTGV